MKIKRVVSILVALVMVMGMLPTTVIGAEVVSATDLLLYPAPRNLTAGSGTYVLTEGNIKSDDQSLKAIARIQKDAKELANVTLGTGTNNVVINISKDESLNEQGYSLIINGDGITIKYKDEPGSYYAAITLYQILWQTGKNIPYLTIENDYPDFKFRGYLLDTSRNRIPKMEKMKKLMDIMSNLKYNQFFLYAHRYSYAYESFPQAWEDSVPITPEYVAELTEYANNIGIDVIPAQNYLGKNDRVLEHFPNLGDTASGKELNLFLPETKEYLSKMTDDIYKGYTSDFMQAGCDEVSFDFENGAVKKSYEALHPGETPTNNDLYYASLEEIYKLLKEKGKKMMYYGDMTVKFSEYKRAKELMPDAIAMNWCYYHTQPDGLARFDYSSKGFHEAGIPFYVCPGDQSWSTVIGDTDTMIGNAQNAAIKGRQYEAIGYCTTHWGDGGCYQNIISSYAGVAYAGAMSWHYDTNIEGVNSYDDFLNMFVYQDKTNTISQAFSKLANYKNTYKIPYDEYVPKALMNDKWDTFTSSSNIWKLMDTGEGKDKNISISVAERDAFVKMCEDISADVDEFLIALENSDMQADDKDLLYKELKNTAQTLKVIVDYMGLRGKVFVGGEVEKPVCTFYEVSDDLLKNAEEMNEVIADFRYIWGERDMLNGQNSTMYQFKTAYDFYKTALGVRNIFGDKSENLFIMTPENLGMGMGATGGLSGIKTWTNSGSNMPMVSVDGLGGTTVEEIKGALKAKVFSVNNGVLSYDTNAALSNGYYQASGNNKLLPTIGFPAVIPADGKYKLSVKAKYKSGQAISKDNIAVSGYATNVTNSIITDVGKTADITVSEAEADGWQTVTAEFDTLNFEAGAFNVMPANSVTTDTLYTKEYNLVCTEVTNATISTYYDESSVVYIGSTVTIPKATSNGKEPVVIKVKTPSGAEATYNMGDSITVNEGGNYIFTYSAEDVKNPLVLTVKSAYVYQDLLDLIEKIEEMDLSLYTNRSVNAINEAVQQSKDLIADKTATKEDFDAQLVVLKKAKNGLELKRPSVTQSMMNVTSNMTPYATWGCVLDGIVDGSNETWTTFANYQEVGNYIQFEFKEPVKLDGVKFVNHSTYKPLYFGDFQVSTDGQNWTTIATINDGEAIEKDFAVQEVKYARIICTKAKREWWSMNEVVLYYQRPKTVDENGYIIKGMSVNKAVTDDIQTNSFNGTDYSADKMIDGNALTMGANVKYYATAGAGSRALTVIDLGDEYELKAVKFILPDNQQITDAFNQVSPDKSYKMMNTNGSAIFASNSVPVRADFSDYDVAATSTATDLVRLQTGSTDLSKGDWDPERRGSVCNTLKEGDTYRYISILTPFSGGHAINEIRVKVIDPFADVVTTGITKFLVDATGNASIEVSNIPDATSVYIAAYDENDNLMELHKVALTDGVASKKFSIVNAKKYKAFVWDGYRPLTKSKTYEP